MQHIYKDVWLMLLCVILLLNGCAADKSDFRGEISGEMYTLVGNELPLYENMRLIAASLSAEIVDRIQEMLVRSVDDNFSYVEWSASSRESLYFSTDWKSTEGIPDSQVAIARCKLTSKGVRQVADEFLNATGLMPREEYRVDVNIPEFVDRECCEIVYTATYKGVPVPGVEIVMGLCPRGIVKLHYYWAHLEADDKQLNPESLISPRDAVAGFEDAYAKHNLSCDADDVFLGGEFCKVYMLTWEEADGKPNYDTAIVHPGYRFYGRSWITTGAARIDAITGICY